MLQIVEAIIGLELCEQSCAEQAALCQGKVHASVAARSEPVIREKITPPMICQHPPPPPPPSEIMKIRPWDKYLSEKNLEREREKLPYSWWEVNESSYPRLAVLARKYL